MTHWPLIRRLLNARPGPTRIAAITLGALIGLSACGERTSAADIDEMSKALSEVLIAVQQAPDSSSRARIADSVARLKGFDDWADLREAVSDVAVEPDRLRAALDSTQKRIEARTMIGKTPMRDTTGINGQQSLESSSVQLDGSTVPIDSAASARAR